MEARILKAIYESLDKGEIVALATNWHERFYT